MLADVANVIGDVVGRPQPPADILAAHEWAFTPSATGWASGKWRRGGVIASVHHESDQTAVEVVFRVIPPGSEEYEAALESEYAGEIQQCRTIESAVLGALREHLPVDEQPGLLVEDGISLVDGACWTVGRWYLTFGVEHADPEDMPILLMARLRPQS